jgi:tripartite-type tricarboxylate transporter receptor subunit TctC
MFRLLVAALFAPVFAFAQATYPSRAVSIIVPFSPGTGIDILARALGERLSARWNEPVVVENKPGASGNIGAEAAAHASPDGYTVLMTATSFATNVPLAKRLPYDPQKSFTPVALVATGTLALVVPESSAAKSVREFVQLAKSQPGKLNYASTGNGTVQHLSMELLKQALGIDLVHVPYKANAGAITDVAGGHVDAMITPVHTAGPLVRQNRLRMLAVLSGERSSVFPAVPTLKEQGLPDLEVEVWYAMFVPAGTPAPIVHKLNADLNAALPEISEPLAGQGLSPVGGSPEKLTAFLKNELARWPKVVNAAGIKAD